MELSEIGMADNDLPPTEAFDDDDQPSLERKRHMLRSPSMELLNPSPDSHLRKSSLFAATFNMVATIVGG